MESKAPLKARNDHRGGGRRRAGLRGHNGGGQLPLIGSTHLLLVCHPGCEDDGESCLTYINDSLETFLSKFFLCKYCFLAGTDETYFIWYGYGSNKNKLKQSMKLVNFKSQTKEPLFPKQLLH